MPEFECIQSKINRFLSIHEFSKPHLNSPLTAFLPTSNFYPIFVGVPAPVLGGSTCFGCEPETGIARIRIIFFDRPMFSHIIQKVWARAFLMWLNTGLS